MSENIPTYETNAIPITREALKARPCSLPYSHPDYRPPTTDEISGLIHLSGWSQNDVAKLVGVTYNPKKGSTTVRKWRAPVTSREYREIPYSAWRLLLLCAGVVSINEDVAGIDIPSTMVVNDPGTRPQTPPRKRRKGE